MTKLLLSHPAVDLSLRNTHGSTALDIAYEAGYTGVVFLLVRAVIWKHVKPATLYIAGIFLFFTTLLHHVLRYCTVLPAGKDAGQPSQHKMSKDEGQPSQQKLSKLIQLIQHKLNKDDHEGEPIQQKLGANNRPTARRTIRNRSPITAEGRHNVGRTARKKSRSPSAGRQNVGRTARKKSRSPSAAGRQNVGGLGRTARGYDLRTKK